MTKERQKRVWEREKRGDKQRRRTEARRGEETREMSG